MTDTNSYVQVHVTRVPTPSPVYVRLVAMEDVPKQEGYVPLAIVLGSRAYRSQVLSEAATRLNRLRRSLVGLQMVQPVVVAVDRALAVVQVAQDAEV